MRVICDIEEVETADGYEGVEATCSRCGHTEESNGTGEGSVKRCLVMLRENCPNNESNFYVD